MLLFRLIATAFLTITTALPAVITGGQLNLESTSPNGNFRFEGTGPFDFILEGRFNDGNIGVSLCSPCALGDVLSVDSSLGGSDVHTGGTINGVPRNDLFFNALYTFEGGVFDVTGVGTYTQPFTLSGFFGGYTTDEYIDCPICPPGQNQIPLSGRGIATLVLVQDVSGVPEVFRVESFNYNFEPIPEPGTMGLLILGGTLLCFRRLAKS